MRCYLLRAARDELNSAALYYEGVREDLGDEFIEDYLMAITEIEEHPNRWPQIRPGIRRFRMSRFPYAVVYQVLTSSVEIIAVAHQARREGYWLDRLK
jgi:hypothetical protein